MPFSRIVAFAAALCGLVLVVSTTAMGADSEGKQIFQSRCAMCHSTTAGVKKIGPSLAAILGKKAGSMPDYNYSAALKNAGITWTPTTLDKWLTNPHQFIPGDRMPFPGMPNKSQRDAIIGYLASISRH